MRIVPDIASYLDTEKVNRSHANVEKTVEISGEKFWLIGSTQGTATVAKEKFRAQAELTVGMLAVAAASTFENGATAFRIGVVMSPEEAYGRSAWMSWSSKKPHVTTHYKFASSQIFEIGNDLVKEFNEAEVFAKAFELFQKETRTSLEEAIARAMYWYSDAHREKVPVMKLIKYWSCVETFFSNDMKEITKSVSTGLACVLVFGRFRFIPLVEYEKTKKRIANLYGSRSKAVHGGLHKHVSAQDAADLSQWIAWMLLNMIAFVDLGYTRTGEVKENCDRLDRLKISPERKS